MGSAVESGMQAGPAAAVQLTQAKCLATDAVIPGRPGAGGHLLAYVAGRRLAIAAVERRLLLLAAAPDAVKPVRCLLECPASITAVAASSSEASGVSGGALSGVASNAGSEAALCWAAALAGSEAHFVPLEASSSGSSLPACVAKAPASSLPGHDGDAAWAACAWHPLQPVCALLAPGQLQLLRMAAGLDGGCSLLLTVPEPASAARSGGALRCSVAWMRRPRCAGAEDGQLAICWGGQELEVLSFGRGEP